MDFLFNEIVVLVVSGLFIIYIALSLYYLKKVKKEKEEEYQNKLFTVAHEVKNPLAVCKGYIEIMNKDSKYTKKKVDVIERQIDECINVMDEYLNVRKNKVSLEYIDMGLLALEVCDNYREAINQKLVSINLNDNDEEFIIKGDYVKLKEALNNIIKNSIESRMDSEMLYINVNLKKENENVKIEIIDNGIGIDNEKIGKSFYTNKIYGNGIGLLVIKNVIKLHNGKIDYIKKERGTLVKITLPLALN